MGPSTIAVLTAALAAVVSGSLVAAPAPPLPRVMVRVFDTSHQPGPQLLAALDETAALMSTAALLVDWRICQAARIPPACTSPVRRGERVVRIVSSPRGPRPSGQIPLGNAVLGATVGTGVLATVYFDRVVRMSTLNACDQNTLLGRAIAHELGHLLLGTNTHAGIGLMREVWTMAELRHNRPGDWEFSASEAETMRLHAGDEDEPRGTRASPLVPALPAR